MLRFLLLNTVDYARVSPLSMNEYIMSVLPLSEKFLMPKILQPLVDHPKSSFGLVYYEQRTFKRDVEGAWHSDDYHLNVKSFPARRFQKMFQNAPVEKVYPELYLRDKEGMILVFRYQQGRQVSFRYCALASAT